ncbi:MAG: hypothetical protein ACRDL2_12975 [Gaiellaceae bacterium]
MDLALYTRVLWRFRVLVVVGFVLACALAFLSYARVSFAGGSPKISYRQGETWESMTRLLITQPGFQLGRLSLGSLYPTSTSPVQSTAPVASPQWLASLALPYQELGNSDVVQATLTRDRTVHGSMTVAAEYAGQNGSGALPILDIRGLAASATDAVHTAQRGAAVFMTYFKRQQSANNVAPANRVQLEVLNNATAPQILVKRKKTLPIVIFVAVMTAVLGLAFILENLRPRIHAVSAESGEELRVREQLGA